MTKDSIYTLEAICEKVRKGGRIDKHEATVLYDSAPLSLLSTLAMEAKKRKSLNNVYYNRNFHIEPTNICRYHCNFCSYKKEINDPHSWAIDIEQLKKQVTERLTPRITEVHLVGGVHPAYKLTDYCQMIRAVRDIVGDSVTVKAFSAVEHICVIEQEGLTYEQGIKMLIESGMDTITGGGAEIFDKELRKVICADKPDADQWLAFHKEAHLQGIITTSTMLYGHIETIKHRIEHLKRLRDLQDETGGFSTFIPLKYRSKNNAMSYAGECSEDDDMRTIAISRIFLDNFDHIKAYSPMYGKERTKRALMFGADDIDGTVKDSTKIYSMAGVSEKGMELSDMVGLIEECGYVAVERDSFFNKILV